MIKQGYSTSDIQDQVIAGCKGHWLGTVEHEDLFLCLAKGIFYLRHQGMIERSSKVFCVICSSEIHGI